MILFVLLRFVGNILLNGNSGRDKFCSVKSGLNNPSYFLQKTLISSKQITGVRKCTRTYACISKPANSCRIRNFKKSKYPGYPDTHFSCHWSKKSKTLVKIDNLLKLYPLFSSLLLRYVKLGRRSIPPSLKD